MKLGSYLRSPSERRLDVHAVNAVKLANIVAVAPVAIARRRRAAGGSRFTRSAVAYLLLRRLRVRPRTRCNRGCDGMPRLATRSNKLQKLVQTIRSSSNLHRKADFRGSQLVGCAFSHAG